MFFIISLRSLWQEIYKRWWEQNDIDDKDNRTADNIRDYYNEINQSGNQKSATSDSTLPTPKRLPSFLTNKRTLYTAWALLLILTWFITYNKIFSQKPKTEKIELATTTNTNNPRTQLTTTEINSIIGGIQPHCLALYNDLLNRNPSPVIGKTYYINSQNLYFMFRNSKWDKVLSIRRWTTSEQVSSSTDIELGWITLYPISSDTHQWLLETVKWAKGQIFVEKK